MSDTHPTEVWREIPNTNGRYMVSSHGRVWQDLNQAKLVRKNMHEIMTPNLSSKGYERTPITYVDKQRPMEIHRLVLRTFVGPPPEGMQCNHKDGNKRNNHLDNLEYVTAAGNMLHAHANKLTPPRTRRKFAERDILRIRFLSKCGFKQTELAELFHVSQGAIWFIVMRKHNYQEIA